MSTHKNNIAKIIVKTTPYVVLKKEEGLLNEVETLNEYAFFD